MAGSEIERAGGLIEQLYGSGALSEQSKDALLEARAAAREIGKGLGAQSSGDEVLLAALLVDDSTSIGSYVSEVRGGHKRMLEALSIEKADADVFVLTRALNHGIISPYTILADAPRLDTENFSGHLQVPRTPLYLQSLLTLGTVLAKSQEEEEHGGRARTFSLIITDGEDNASAGITAAHVKAIVTDMLEFSTAHIVAGMGIGERVDFRQVFRSMGIPDGWIFTPGNTVDELRAVFRKIARSLQIAAKSEVDFLQLTAGPVSDD